MGHWKPQFVRLGYLWLTIILFCAGPGRADEGTVDVGGGERLALLIGCTRYPYCPQAPELWGPANDVPVFARLLQTKFDFPSQNVRILLGWPEDPRDRPTRENITEAFETLIRQAKRGTQIFIMISGHGTQVPVEDDQLDPLDPRNREFDGLDEVFLPADVEPGLARALRDNQIADWLGRLQGRGARVWIVFDCCHAGTMTRSDVERERARGVSAWDLGVSPESLRRAGRLAAARGQESRPTSAPRRSELLWDASREPAADEAADQGTIAAFFAAQAYEIAPEMPQPRSATRSRENYYGLLSYSLARELEQLSGGETYRDLGRRIAARYRAQRGSRGPTPMFTGALDQDVLGRRRLSNVPIYLERMGGQLRLSAGAPAGLTPGSILAVHPPDTDRGDATRVLGYVRVTRVTPLFSDMESTTYGDARPPLDLQQIPPFSTCSIVRQELGDLRLSVAISASTDTQLALDRARLEAALMQVASRLGPQMHVTANEENAQWVLRVVSASQARRDYAQEAGEPGALLLAGERLTCAGEPLRSAGVAETIEQQLRPRVYAHYRTADVNALTRELERDLRKIFRWQTLWHLTCDLPQSPPTEKGLRLDVLSLDRLQRAKAGADKRPASHVLQTGDLIEVHLSNTSAEDQWATLLYLDANFGIHVWASEAIKAAQALEPLAVQVDDESLGAEGFIVLAAPVRHYAIMPDYEFLEQNGLGLASRSVAAPRVAVTSSFQRLLRALRDADPVWERAEIADDPATPQVLSWVWVSTPAAEAVRK